ncbi:hypothetical protein [Niallia sp. Krafla_26]|uniref:hypothetical protein n=1 Tax=Niallia sp. Krafla_26 TaxID=3064703 RepID=UPI003D18054D
MRVFVYAAVPILYLTQLFMNVRIIDTLILTFAILSIVFSFKQANRLYRTVGCIFLLIGIWLWSYSSFELDILRTAFHQMAGILGLFVVLPFIQSIIRVGKYDKSMNKLLHYRVQTVHGVYCRTSLGVYILSVFLAIAAIPIGAHSFGKKIPVITNELKQHFLNSSMIRPFALALFWSPIEMVVLVGVDVTNADYGVILPILLGVSICFLTFDWFLQRKKYTILIHEFEEKPIEAFPKKELQKSGQLLLVILVLFAMVMLTNRLLGFGMLISIIFILAPFSLIWSMCIRKFPILIRRLKKTWPEGVIKMANFNILFLSASFFLTMVQKSPVFSFLNEILVTQFDFMHLFIFCIFVSLVLWFLSYLGIHAVVLIVLLAQILNPFFIGNENGLAFLLIATLLALLMVNPFNVVSSMMTNIIGINPIRLVRWNLGYTICLIITVDVIAYLLLL